MKDNLQNISDLIGALAEDIEGIKKILAAKDASDKDEAVKRLAVKLEPVIRFFGGSTSENISEIFRSKETIEAYKKSLGGKMIVSLQEYTDANDKNMRERGIPTTKDLLYKYNRPRWQVGHKKIAVQSLGGYFCEGFQRSGSRSRYFSIGVFGGHAAQRSMMSQK